MKKIVLGLVALTSFLGAASIAIAQNKVPYLNNTNQIDFTGKIVQIGDDELILDDGTNKLLVDVENMTLRTANLKKGEMITVKFKSDDDDLEAISITRVNGQVIYVFDD